MFSNACSYNAQCVPNWNVQTFSSINYHSMLSFYVNRITICWRDDPSHRDAWRCHWRRRRQQCLIKFYNLVRLKWSSMGSDLKSRTLPLATTVLFVPVRISGFLHIKLQLLLLFPAEHPARDNDRSEENFSCSLGQQWLWSQGLLVSYQCSQAEISTMEHNGIN